MHRFAALRAAMKPVIIIHGFADSYPCTKCTNSDKRKSEREKRQARAIRHPRFLFDVLDDYLWTGARFDDPFIYLVTASVNGIAGELPRYVGKSEEKNLSGRWARVPRELKHLYPPKSLLHHEPPTMLRMERDLGDATFGVKSGQFRVYLALLRDLEAAASRGHLQFHTRPAAVDRSLCNSAFENEYRVLLRQLGARPWNDTGGDQSVLTSVLLEQVALWI
jgi:hypothetical protein